MKKYLAMAFMVALAATIGGLLVLDSAQGSSAATTERPAAVDADDVQVEVGDQTAPDMAAAASESATESESAGDVEAADESATAAEPAGENEPADGGHEDAGENAEHEFDGVE